MISRVAESCYWMQRYMERAETTARMLATTSTMRLDVPGAQHWTSVLIVTGEHPSFVQRHAGVSTEDTDAVLEYLTWDPDCPVSIRSSLDAARENARTTRETISREAWEALNETWLWMASPRARRAYKSDAASFFGTVRDAGYRFRGATLATMLDDEPLRFLALGLWLERADQTARALDVKHHALGPTEAGARETAADTVAWITTLLVCSAYEGYFKRHQGSVRGRRVARFLLQEERFPRSIAHCIERARGVLTELTSDPGRPPRALGILDQLRATTLEPEIDALLAQGIHGHLTGLIEGLAEASASLYTDFFDPRLPEATARAPVPAR